MFTRVCVLLNLCLLSLPTCFLFLVSSHVLPHLCFPSRIGPLHFQARGHRRRPNLVFDFFGFILCYSNFVFGSIVDCDIVDSVIYVRLCLYFSPDFDFVFSVMAKRLAGKSISRMKYYCQVTS